MSTTANPALTLSIVSHGHAQFIDKTLSDILALGWDVNTYEILLTFNIPEDHTFVERYQKLPLRTIVNQRPVGFGANQNAAFRESRGRFFIIVNPDIRITQLDLKALLCPFDRPRVGACAPLVVSSEGVIQDSSRRFPTLGRLAWRILSRRREPEYAIGTEPIDVDWVAGMFVVFDRHAYEQIGGFDERYFMYFEDVDLCARLRRAGRQVLLQPTTSVIHDAQRASHRNAVHLRWHLRSALRYFTGL